MDITKTCNSIIYNNYRLCSVVFLTVYIVLTLGCTVQNDGESQIKSETFQTSPNSVNINTATVEELKKIPHIGEKLALDIIKHRETYGPFRKPEHLMLIPGISDKRFREIRAMIRTE